MESELYALNGMRRQSMTAFHDDCRELISGTGFLSELLLTTVGAIKQLEAEETEVLLALFVEYDLLSEPQAVTIELAALRAHAEETPEKAATTALDALWRAGFSRWIERRLDELATGSKKTGAQQGNK